MVAQIDQAARARQRARRVSSVKKRRIEIVRTIAMIPEKIAAPTQLKKPGPSLRLARPAVIAPQVKVAHPQMQRSMTKASPCPDRK